jgi:hypothetical protein
MYHAEKQAHMLDEMRDYLSREWDEHERKVLIRQRLERMANYAELGKLADDIGSQAEFDAFVKGATS